MEETMTTKLLLHIEGMLTRDQRTAKMRYSRRCNEEITEDVLHQQQLQRNGICGFIKHSHHHHQQQPHHDCPSIISYSQKSDYCGSCKRPNRTLINTTNSKTRCLQWRKTSSPICFSKYQSLKNVLLVSVCLTLISLPSRISCAPTNIKMSSVWRNDPPKWINPCGLPATNGSSSESFEGTPVITEKELIEAVSTATQVALSKANEFLEIYAQERWNMNHSSLHSILVDQHLRWLTRLPKSLNESIPEDHLHSLEFNTILVDLYEYLQKIAVSLEQMTWDASDKMDIIFKKSQDSEHQLRSLLCELQMAMYELGIKMRPDVTRELMTPEERKVDYTARKTRDWIVLREYVNTLEYANQALQHLNKTL